MLITIPAPVLTLILTPPPPCRPSGSANTLSTSQWNSVADGGAAADSSAADETETRTDRTAGSSSGEDTEEDVRTRREDVRTRREDGTAGDR